MVRREHSRDKISMASSGQAVLASLLLLTVANEESKRARDVMRMELSKALKVIPGSSPTARRVTKKDNLLSVAFRFPKKCIPDTKKVRLAGKHRVLNES